ncbi:GNAT family N-acetyltransferase [Chloroflexota bacterium]
MSDYTIRNYIPSDFDSYVRLRQQVEALEPTGWPVTPQNITESMKHPHYTPEKDLFLIESGENLIGYMKLEPEPGIKRTILSCWIHPEHRRKGLVRKLLGYASTRAVELHSKVLHIVAQEDNEAAAGVLKKLGFTPVRKFLDIKLDMEKVIWQDIDQTKLDFRCLLPGEESKLAEIQNRAFAEHWGFNPNTVEDIVYDISRGNNSHKDVIVTCEGDDFSGYCWTEIPHSDDTTGKKKGMIHMIGTDPVYRSTGAGRRVLLAGLLSLKERGIEVTVLTVDSENTVARALYESIGFEFESSYLWYEKTVK